MSSEMIRKISRTLGPARSKRRLVAVPVDSIDTM